MWTGTRSDWPPSYRDDLPLEFGRFLGTYDSKRSKSRTKADSTGSIGFSKVG